MSSVETVTYVRELDGRQITEAQSQSHALWGKDLTLPDRLTKLKALMDLGGPGLLRMSGITDSRERVLTSLKRYGLSLVHPDGSAAPGLGLGAIYTPESHRGRGLAEELIQCVLAEARSEGMSCALLYSDIGTAYYERFGFRAFPARRWAGPTSALPCGNALSTRAAAEHDLPWLIETHEKSWPKECLRASRDVGRWRFYRLRNAPGGELILSDGKRDVGYAILDTDATFSVLELVVDERHAAAAWSAIRARAEAGKHTRVSGWLRAEQVPQGFTSIGRKKAIPMVAALDARFDLAAFTAERAHFSAFDYF